MEKSRPIIFSTSLGGGATRAEHSITIIQIYIYNRTHEQIEKGNRILIHMLNMYALTVDK